MNYTKMNYRQHRYVFFVLALFSCLFLPIAIEAATRTWDGGGVTNNWSEAANWSDDTAPVNGDEIIFNAAGTKNATIDVSVSVFNFFIQSGYTGTITQAGDTTVTTTFQFTQSAGTFVGGNGAFNFPGAFLTIQNTAAFQGGTGLISGNRMTQNGGTFTTSGNIELGTFDLLGGAFNAPAGIMTVVADWTHTASGTFNAGTGTVKLTGYNTFNCQNSYSINVAQTLTFYNLEIANSFCNARYIAADDTLIVNGDLRLSYARIGGGRIRANGTTTIDATNNGYAGSTVVEYLQPNRNFIINNPASAVDMLPVEMNASNSTLTGSGAGRINFGGMTLIDGTVNQGAGIWDLSIYPGYSQSGGTFNGSAAALFISNGLGNPMITGGVFNSGTGKITSSFRMTGGTMSIAGDMDTSDFSLEGGTFNAPLGTMRFTGGNGNCFFRHTLGGTFNARTGTVETQFGGCAFDVNQNETFYNLRFSGGNQSNFISAGDELNVSNLFNVDGGGSSSGSIIAGGDVNYTNGGVFNGNATTVVKFQDAAARTVNLSPSGASFGAYPTVVDNPNITINTNLNADENFIIKQLTLQQGTFNQGAGRAAVGAFNQSGGTYNGGTFSQAFGSLNSFDDFTLTGGDFNAAPSMTLTGNFTHATATGNFNEGTGTVFFYSTFFPANGEIDVNSSETFYNVAFYSGNGTNIAAGDTLIVNGTTTLRSGTLNGGTLDVKGNVTATTVNNGGNFQGGDASVIFSGATNQTFTNLEGRATFGGIWTINKPDSTPLDENGFVPAAPTTLLLNGSVGNAGLNSYPAFNIVSGNVVQAGTFSHALGSLAVAAGTSFVNEFGGTLTLAGNLTNDGLINLDGGGSGCPQADAIAIRSSIAGTQRNWSGTGIFRLVDVDLKDQNSTTNPITVYSGTDAGNNTNFFFNAGCIATTAAAVSISGRVLKNNGSGVSNAQIVIVDAAGQSRYAVTNQFGFYRFEDIAAGQTLIVTVSHKIERFGISTLVLNVSEELTDVNFSALDR